MTENGQKTILHVEDNFDNRVLVRRLLMSQGYQVLEAENATKAFSVLTTSHPDLILMDINMPDIDGYTLTSRIKALDHMQQIPIIAITANVMRGDKERSIQAGCDGYIEKPINIDLFFDIIAQFTK